jgi:hypothetical protein
MKTPQSNTGVFRKVGECLYRYSSNGVYYARFKTDGKEIRRSLETTDPHEARRKLAAEKAKERQTDRSQGKLTLRELCDRWLKTIQDSKRKTLEQKIYIAARIQEHWPGGSLVQVAKIKPSDCGFVAGALRTEVTKWIWRFISQCPCSNPQRSVRVGAA